MAKSKYEYVKNFELDDKTLPDTYMVVRIDGRGFHKLTELHSFVKPNDSRGLRLMNKCAEAVMKEFPDVFLAYGESDEFSFIFQRKARLFQRRASKIITNIVSLFASSYVFYWPFFMGHEPWEGDVDPAISMEANGPPQYDSEPSGQGQRLQYPPTFDARVVCYPSVQTLRDYVSWRQADCHVNNLYNTCNWMLVRKAGMSGTQAEEELKGTISKEKLNEILFSRFGINYAKLPEMYRKGSCLVRESQDEGYVDARTGETKAKKKAVINTYHCDLIGDEFWTERPFLLQ